MARFIVGLLLAVIEVFCITSATILSNDWQQKDSLKYWNEFAISMQAWHASKWEIWIALALAIVAGIASDVDAARRNKE